MAAENTENAGRYASARHPRQPVFFIIFGHQRTGSTLLASRLDSHPGIRCYEEIFLPSVDSSPSMREWLETKRLPQCARAVPSTRASFLSWLFSASNLGADVGAVGFKVMYDQIALWSRPAFLLPVASRFQQDPALRRWIEDNRVLIIHILRRNHLKILASQKLAAQTGRFHSRNPTGPDMKVVLSLQGLKLRLRRIELAERAARRYIFGLPTIEIYYEDYTSGGAGEADVAICTALGQDLPAGGLSSPLTKLTSDNLYDTVANYDAVAAHLSGTRYERFLS